jgi:PAS domain S-box-containing protein
MLAPSLDELEPLRMDGDFVLSRAPAGVDRRRTLVLATTSDRPSAASLARLEHEYQLRSELDASWAACPLALVQEHGRPGLLLSDPGGRLLSSLVGRPWQVEPFLRVAIALGHALARVHERGLIHKDVKPGNVLVDTASSRVWLTGFGIASRLPRELRAPEPPEMILGTLAYMAPEQTGRMNRSLDSRSDLYAYGVTLYELLTGTLPFTASEPMEWVHCHVAKQPAPPEQRVPGLPRMLSALVLKLLAKAPEQRYQTAAGVVADLQACLGAFKRGESLDTIALGAHDVSGELIIPERLYGREREVQRLVAAFERVLVRGRPELMLVTGYSGIGKSSVVNELHKALVVARAQFASGKCDQYKRDIPYSTLAQALASLVRVVLGQSEAAVQRRRDEILAALGHNGQLILNLIPELELIIGKQPPVLALPPQDAHNRFQRVLIQFLAVFARREQPLVLFLDDLQWVDRASIRLIEELMTQDELEHLLLIGAYRDNEVGPAHPLSLTLDTLAKGGAPVQRIVLAALEQRDMRRLVCDTLRCDAERAEPLATLVQEKTGGNPFFAIQFLSELSAERLLTFDAGSLAWIFDLSSIRAKGFTDNVVDLVAAKLNRLPAATLSALKSLACLGGTTEAGVLCWVLAQSEAEVHVALWQAVLAGLVLRLDDAYKFSHDRVQEAAYALIPAAERPAVHLALGQHLAQRTPLAPSDENLFEIANQIGLGLTLISEPGQRRWAAELNLRAGRKAKAAAAHASAAAYLAVGMRLLDEHCWRDDYELALALWLERAESELCNSSINVAEELILGALRYSRSNVDRASAYRLRVLLHEMKNENRLAIASALECLRMFGIDLPEHPSQEQIRSEYAEVWRKLEGRTIESLLDLPVVRDAEVEAAMQVFAVLSSPAFLTDGNLYCMHLCRMVNYGLEHGTSGASGHAYASFGWILGHRFGRYDDGFRFAALAARLVEKHAFFAAQPSVQLMTGLVAFWTRPVSAVVDYTRAALRSASELGAPSVMSYSASQQIWILLVRGDPLDRVQAECERALALTRKAEFGYIADMIQAQQRAVQQLRGQTPEPPSIEDTPFDEQAFEAGLGQDHLAALAALHWILKMQVRFLSGDHDAAVDASERVVPLSWSITGLIQSLNQAYFGALSHAAVYDTRTGAEQALAHARVSAAARCLREWAEHNAATFADKSALVNAELARVERRELDAERLYEQAIRDAHANGFVQYEAIAHELAARFYGARGFDTIARAYYQNARYCYERWGADGKVRQLDRERPYLARETTELGARVTIGAPSVALDLATVVRVSHALSGEIILEKLMETLLSSALEHAGASRGVLLLPSDGGLAVEAEADTEPERVIVRLRHAVPSAAELPEAILHYVVRTQQSVILDDASLPNQFSVDPYLVASTRRSVLCLPLLKQGELRGVLYLENDLAPYVFTPGRIAVLELLASQAAISLENAALYANLARENRVRRQTEEALRRSESYLAEAQRMSQTGSFGWNTKTGAAVWSSETYRLIGFPEGSKVQADEFFARVHQQDAGRARQTIERAVRDHVAFDLEYRLFMPDGSVRQLHALGRPALADDGSLEYVGSISDVTAQRQSQRALEAAFRELEAMKDQLRLAVDTIPELMWSALPDGLYDFVNQRFRNYTGMSLEGLTHTGWQGAVHPDDLQPLLAAWRATLASGRSMQHEARMRRADGEFRRFVVRAVPLLDDTGRALKWFGTNTDVEDQRRAQEALEQAQAELARVTRVTTLGELAASIAHEINQPLAAIIADAHACLNWLRGSGNDVDNVREALGAIVSDGNRAAQVLIRIRALLARSSPAAAPCDLNTVISSVLPLVRPALAKPGIALETLLPGEPLTVNADPVQLQQVVLNLLLNAAEASRGLEPARLRVVVRAMRERRVEGPWVRVSIEDLGVGIDARDTARLFEAFYTTKAGGLGMGLSISRSIIERHGGKLWATPNSEHGSTFHFSLPGLA